MRILNSLYYYRPHYSGLTVYTERLARGLARRGHQVTVLTSRYDRSLPGLERLDGVQVYRLPVALRVSKGPIMPTLPFWAGRMIPRHDIVHLHVPQLDAAHVALMAKAMGKPVVLTYHCDLRLPSSILNRVANLLSSWANRVSVAAADVVVANAMDYAEASATLRRHLNKVVVIPPPIELPAVSGERVQGLRERLGLTGKGPLIGMAARLATEKGAEFLAQALPRILERYPEACVLYVGQYEDVLGEQDYGRRIAPLIQALGDHWRFLGILDPDDLAAFFAACDVTVLPSLNSTESFGMVQVESMLCGTPVVASDLPGVRYPTQATGMGLTVPPADAEELAEGILKVLSEPDRFSRPREDIQSRFGTEAVADRYEKLFEETLKGKA
ncbi:MAG TPA: glycosyltransferase family 1 protein [Chloroflexi bacterium]|nr:glycosyltransferase family 1 protein [Chloroflexota bacterium]